MRLRSWLSTGCLALLVAALGAPASAQSLAELAEKEKKRRQGKVTKVFTNDDLGERSQGAPSPEPSASPEQAGVDESADRRAQEASWRSRADAARAAVRVAEEKVARFEAELKDLAQDMEPNPSDLFDPARLNKREAAKAETRSRLDEAEIELEAAEDAISELEEEARRKGVPPGWLRER